MSDPIHIYLKVLIKNMKVRKHGFKFEYNTEGFTKWATRLSNGINLILEEEQGLHKKIMLHVLMQHNFISGGF